MSEVKTPREWEDELGVLVIDPDGWRVDRRSFDEPLDRADFITRMKKSTIRIRRYFVGWEALE